VSLAVPGVEGLEEVGRGGSGVVHRAWQPDFGRWVAVKVFAADEDVRRLERERLAVGRLSDHPGIVPVLDGGVTSDGRPFLIMSYMDGGSLADRVTTRGPLPPDELVAFGIAMCAALQVAHDHGVQHRDIKPANILYDRFGTPRLADFGIAHLGDNAFRTEAGMISGTVAYMAPELIDGRPFTAAADVFSLGATLYYALEGHHLFEPRPQELYAAFLVRRLTAPHSPAFSSAVPGWLREVVVAATEPDLARRLPTAAALGAALARGPARREPPAPNWAPPLPPPPPGVAPSQPLPPPPMLGTAPPMLGTAPPMLVPPPPMFVTDPPLPVTAGVATPRSWGRPLLVGAAAVAVIALATALWVNTAAGRGTAAGTGSSPVVITPAAGGPAASSPAGHATPAAGPPTSAAPGTPDPTSDPTPAATGGAPSILAAVAAYRTAAGGGDPLALEMVFYPFPEPGSSPYALATLPQRTHPVQADRFEYRDGQVGAAEPVQASDDLAANKRWHFSDVSWSSMASMLRSTDAVCRGAMAKAGFTDQPDTFGKKAGISHVMVERDTVFNDGHVIVRVYFTGGARWSGGYVPFSATGKILSRQFCTTSG